MIRVYITPLDSNGNFLDEIEVTNFVDTSSLSSIKAEIDDSDYGVGVFKYSNLKIKLKNNQGTFSRSENLSSIFRGRRFGSKVRITWAIADYAYCGFAVCGETYLADEIDLFVGILDDTATKLQIKSQYIDFNVLSLDYLFSKVLFPFDDVSNGDLISEVIYTALNQSEITKYLTVDALNIDCQVDYAIDDVEPFDGETVKNVLDKLLLASNSVLQITDSIVNVVDRAVSGDLAYTFYGQSSNEGNENIVDIKDYRTGENRVINLCKVEDTTDYYSDASSIQTYGASKKDIKLDFVTTDTKRVDTCEGIVNEFKDAKAEFKLVASFNYSVLALGFKSKVNIDYPSVIIATSQFLPIIGQTAIGDDLSKLPFEYFNFKIELTEFFKVMGVTLNLKDETIEFLLRGA